MGTDRAQREIEELQALAHGLDPDEGQWGLRHKWGWVDDKPTKETVWGYESEEEARHQYGLASMDIFVTLVQFVNGKWTERD